MGLMVNRVIRAVYRAPSFGARHDRTNVHNKEIEMKKTATYKTTGTRKVNGTEWPIESKLEKTGPRDWTVTYGICAGIASSSESFRTKKEALANF